MKTLRRCHVTFDDKVLPDLSSCLVQIVGTSPNCTVKISEWKGDGQGLGKFSTVERLTRASVVENGKRFTIDGESETLRREALLVGPDARVSVLIEAGADDDDCENCR